VIFPRIEERVNYTSLTSACSAALGGFFRTRIIEIETPTPDHGWSAVRGKVNWISIGALCCLWVGLVTFGWARWGSVTVDSGREIYVAAALAEGKMLYRDVWYPYGPGAPYLNAVVFRMFGIHITVAYLAGALAGLAVALTLFRCALYLMPIPVAFALGYIVLIQSFGPGIFTYPLPYSYASVYGAVATCFFLLYAIRGAFASTTINVFWAGIWAAVALLMKLEYGLACFATLAVLQLGLLLKLRSWRAAFGNFLVTMPALVICAAVSGWLISIGGVAFITQENFMSWPTSYFMRTYGQFWLGGMGYDWSWNNVRDALLVTAGFVIFWAGFRFWLQSVSRRPSFYNSGLAILFSAGAIAFWMTHPERVNDDIAKLVFPRPMVFMLGLAAPLAAFLFWRNHWNARDLAILVVMTFGPLLAFRMLFGMVPYAYAIFYNGPVLLAFCLLLVSVAIPTNDFATPRVPTLVLCFVLGGWVTLQVYPDYLEMRKHRVALESNRGIIYVPETMLPAWAEAVDFMRDAKTRAEAVMSVPEDTGLYFFAGALCPVRVCIFTPGLVAPGPMTDKVIEQIEQARVRYIIWSNRTFPEYGVPQFGVDFDVAIGEYIRNRYHPVSEFGATNTPEFWHATLWERK
jgi:hypothetical protein